MRWMLGMIWMGGGGIGEVGVWGWVVGEEWIGWVLWRKGLDTHILLTKNC
jgi:hypothetical protein